MKALLFATAAALAAAIASAADLTAAEKAAIFKAAGFKSHGGGYTRCAEDTAPSHVPGAIELQDLNADGKNEALVSETSTYCYGNTEQAFVLLTQDAKGTWTIVLDQVGIATPLDTKHKGWRDVEVGGPGDGPFPVYQYNGTKYAMKK